MGSRWEDGAFGGPGRLFGLCSIGWWEGVEVANETSTRCLMYAGKGTLWMLLMLMLPS
jgi:hypothetical protein